MESHNDSIDNSVVQDFNSVSIPIQNSLKNNNVKFNSNTLLKKSELDELNSKIKNFKRKQKKISFINNANKENKKYQNNTASNNNNNNINVIPSNIPFSSTVSNSLLLSPKNCAAKFESISQINNKLSNSNKILNSKIPLSSRSYKLNALPNTHVILQNVNVKINSNNVNTQIKFDPLTIHECYIARKVFKHWKEFTRKSVNNKKATECFKKKILKKAFNALKQNHWEKKEEWKLEIRADVHFKNVLLGKAWNSWKTYEMKKNKKRERLKIIDNIANKNKIRYFFTCWYTYHRHCLDKQALIETANSQYNYHLQLYHFNLWRKHKKKREKEKSKYQLAVQYNKYQIYYHYLNIWNAKLNEAKLQKKYEELSIEWYKAHLKQVIIEKWKIYHEIEKRKKVLNGKLVFLK